MLEIFRGRVLQVRQDFRKAAHIQETCRLQHLRGLANPLNRPRNIMLLALETIPISLFNVIRRIGKHQINTSIVQRSQPINRIALKQLAVRVFVLELEAFGNRLKAKLFAIGGSADVVDIL